MAIDLPSGSRGKALAVGITMLGLAFIWLTGVMPLLGWNQELVETRADKTRLESRMASIAETLPALQRQVDGVAGKETPAITSLPGATDALAAASLQDQLQEMARKAGVTLASVEALPVEAVGQFRRIGLRLIVQGRWVVLIQFLQAIEQSRPRILVDDLQLQRGAIVIGTENPLNASFAVLGFRSVEK